MQGIQIFNKQTKEMDQETKSVSEDRKVYTMLQVQ